MTRTIRLTVLSVLAAPVAAQSWAEVTPATSPSPRAAGLFVGDGSVAPPWLIGGGDPLSLAVFADIWGWDGASTSWTVRAEPAPGPVEMGAAYDTVRSRFVTFGGQTPGAPPTYYDLVFEWDGSIWFIVTPAVRPAPRRSPGMAFDAARGVSLVFGGADSTETMLSDTWTFDGTTWTQRAPVHVPPARSGAQLVHDAARAEVVLFGGIDDAGVPLGDTWTWDGSDWTQRTPASAPTARFHHRAVWDAARQRVVLFGGIGAGGAVGDTWEWDGTAWSDVSPVAGPGARFMHAMVFDVATQRTVVFGGVASPTGPLLGDTWEFTPAATGGGSTWPHATVAVGTAPLDVALGDLDGDGHLDAVTANSGSDDVSVLLGDGAGAFVASVPVALGVGSAPRSIAVGDLDGDGAADDFAVALEGTHQVALVTNPSGGAAVTASGVAGLRPACVAVGDLDAGDPTDDVVVGREGEPFAGGAGLAILVNGGAPVDVPIPPGTADRVVRVVVVDVDDDGDQDVVAVARGVTDAVLLFAGDGAGGLAFADAIPLGTSGLASGLCVGDVDADGDVDLAALRTVLFPSPSVALRVLLHGGSGGLAAADYTAQPSDVALAGSFAAAVACADIDQAGIAGFTSSADFVVVDAGTGTVDALFGYDATTNGFASSDAPAAGSNPVAVALGDVDGDGSPDVVVANQGSDDVTVSLASPVGVAQAFGAGCAGTGGVVPAIGASGPPTIGAAAFGVTLASARAHAASLLLFAAALDPVGFSGGCTVYPLLPSASVLRFSDATGSAAYAFGIPNDPTLVGLDLFFQWAVFDPAGAFASLLAMSDALRLQVGG